MKIKKSDKNYFLDTKTLSYKKKPTKLQLWKKLKCFIYARVSSKDQMLNWNGIENQISICKRFAIDKGYELVEVFFDCAVSWKLNHRESFDKMLRELKIANRNEIVIDYVVISEYSRFSRHQKLWITEAMEDEIKETWCHLHFEKWNLATDNPNDALALDNERIKAKHESIENSTRTISRMTWRMLDWYYVLAHPPGYFYEKIPNWLKKTSSLLKKNEDQFYIIKEWLEGYANWIFQSHTQLLDFYNSKLLWLHSKNTKPGHLRLTFIQRLLEIDRLYLYAWYIIYAEFGIFEPVDAKHEPMITIWTMYKIIDKENKRNNVWWRWVKNDRNGTHPLIWLLYCCNCDRSLTSLVAKWNGWIYHYYWCNRKDCSGNYSIRTEEADKEFFSLLSEMKPKKWVMLLMDSIFNEAFYDKNISFEASKKKLKSHIQDIDRQIESKYNLLEKLNNVNVLQKMEEEIWKLMQEKCDLEDRLNDKFADEQDKSMLYNKFKWIIENPVWVWELWNKDLRSMLLKVLFDGKLYYNKKDGYKTIQNEHIYAGLNKFFDLKVLYGGTDETRTRDLSSDSAAF